VPQALSGNRPTLSAAAAIGEQYTNEAGIFPPVSRRLIARCRAAIGECASARSSPNMIASSPRYSLVSAVGRLSAEELHLTVTLYDPMVH
jgi:hypothetical protein